MMLTDQRGQITVYLSMSFLVFLGLAVCLLEGIHSYMESALAEEAVIDAGNEILADYDPYLFEKYHVFFLDPRENRRVEDDAVSFLNQDVPAGFYGFQCLDIERLEEKTAVDDKGIYLLYQIKEYMDKQKADMVGEGLKQLLQLSGSGMGQLAGQTDDFNRDEGGGAEDKQDGQESDQDKPSPETLKHRLSWSKLSESLTRIARSGILVYAADQSLSPSVISRQGLPSTGAGRGGRMDRLLTLPDFTWKSFSQWKSFLKEGESQWTGNVSTGWDQSLAQYLKECFSCYGKKAGEDKTALMYELEYLAAGRASDKENLKAVADRILWMRFLTNYSYASRDAGIQAEAGTIALALAGILQFPEAAEAVQVLLTAALSYGESVLELHALLSGSRLALIKNGSNWNLTFANAAEKLQNKAAVKGVEGGVSYQDYLMVLLALKNADGSLIWRMMDLMQANTALHEPGFRMEDSLFSFDWKVRLACGRWFHVFPGNSAAGDHHFIMEVEKRVSYK